VVKAKILECKSHSTSILTQIHCKRSDKWGYSERLCK